MTDRLMSIDLLAVFFSKAVLNKLYKGFN